MIIVRMSSKEGEKEMDDDEDPLKVWTREIGGGRSVGWWRRRGKPRVNQGERAEERRRGGPRRDVGENERRRRRGDDKNMTAKEDAIEKIMKSDKEGEERKREESKRGR